jgi:hypothetical protein
MPGTRPGMTDEGVVMAKARRPTKPKSDAPGSAPEPSAPEADASSASEEQIAYSNLSLHELFQQQTRAMLDRTDLDEEQKQNILVAMSCPCCGAGGLSFSAKLKRRT